METANVYDLAVIGGGIMGSFHAYHAAKLGKRVLLLEKDPAPNGATIRNFGQVVPSGQELGRWQNYGRRGLEIYGGLQAKTDLSLRNNGSIYIASDQDEWQLLNELHDLNKADGYASQLLSQAQVLQKYPRLKASYVVGGLYYPQEYSAEPRKMVNQLIAYMQEALPVDYRPNTLVQECVVNGDRVQLQSATGQHYQAEQALICNGHIFQHLYPSLFWQSGIVVSKLQMMATQAMPQVALPGNILTGHTIRRYESFRSCPSHAAITATVKDQFAKDWGIHILFKQAVDGSIIIGDSHEYAPAGQEQSLMFGQNEEVNRYMLRLAREIMDLPSWTLAETWAGYYAQHPTKPCFEHTIEGRIHIITAIGGKGMTTTPGFAEENIHRLFAHTPLVA